MFTNLPSRSFRICGFREDSEDRRTAAAHQRASRPVLAHRFLKQPENGEFSDRRRLQRIEQTLGDARQIILGQSAQEQTNFWELVCQSRVGRCFGPIPISPFRRNAEAGVDEQNASGEVAGDRLNPFAPTAAHGCTLRQEKIDVRTEPRSKVMQGCVGQIQFPEPVQTRQYGRGVAAATAKTRRQWCPFAQQDSGPAIYARVFRKQFGRS